MTSVPRTSTTLVRRRAALAGALVLAVLVSALASCGISSEPDANRIEPTDVPFGLLDDKATTTSVEAGRTAEVYLLTKDKLLAVDRSVPDDASLSDLLSLLIAGPTEVEQSLGITSAVPAGTIASVRTSRGTAKVDLTPAFGDIRSGEQLLALAQIVYTLTGQPGIGGVRFSVKGKKATVPLSDGTNSDEALSRDDFEALQPG